MALPDSGLPPLTVADFREHTYLNCTPDTPLRNKLDIFSQQLPLTIRELRDLPTDSTLAMVAECFIKKGCFMPFYPNFDLSDMKHIRRVWPRLQRYSFGLVDSSGRLLGVATNADAVDFQDVRSDAAESQKHPFIVQIQEYLGSLRQRVKDRLPDENKLERGVLLDMYMYGIPFNVLTPSENLYVMYRLVEETHRRAVEHGFQHCVSENSHPYTQILALFFGCDRLIMDHPHDFVNSKGEKSFDLVPEKITVAVDLRTYF
ncbi:hypothetical protein RvY_04162 [Ramazzottius varieornatus]|uniref:Uncharacterized protein n=1 Tax=Ramazzottius varieornatus TaxID=947166 RepID=A0A1D1UWB2_RAMVA|nr:hypothetical protein RvY_04162 [Ramazzottius varieornatus]